MSSAFLGVQLAIAQARREMDAEGIDCSKVGIIIELPHDEFRRFLASALDYQRFAGVHIDMDATEFVLMGAIVRKQQPKQITYDWHRKETDSAVSPVRELSPIRKALARAEVFAANYEFDSDEGCHTPSDMERLLMLDMLNGLFDDEEFINVLSRRSLDTAVPATNMFARGAREDIAVMPEGEVPIEFRTGGEIERARLASRTPDTETLDWVDDVTPEAVQIMRSAAAPYLAGADLEQVDPPIASPNTEMVVKAEPVAWRWKWGSGGVWYYGSARPSDDDPRSPYFGKLTTVTPLYASPPSPAEVTEDMVERDKAKAEAIELLLNAYEIWDDYGSGFRIHFSFKSGADMRVIERINTARALTAALQLNKKG